MDERVASMREFVANFWISETLRGEFDSGCVTVSSVFQSSRDPHLRTSLAHESIVILLGARREGITEAAHKLQAAALIYRRGNIRVVDRKGLEKKSVRVPSGHPAAVQISAPKVAATGVIDTSASTAVRRGK